MVSRPAILPADFAQIDELLRDCEEADHLDLTLHRHALQEQQSTEHFQLWLDDNALLQGFARLYFSEIDSLIEGRYWYYIRPTAMGLGIERLALAWAELACLRRLAESVYTTCRLSTGSRADHPVRFQFLEASGFTRERSFFTMTLALNDLLRVPVVPAGYTIRSAMLAEIESYTALQNLAFREHWNSPPTTVDELREEMLDPEYCSEIDILAVASDGTLAGYSTATIESVKYEGLAETVGFIASLGTDPSYRGIGLGRALLLHNLSTLRALGMRTAHISVDAANATGAVHLYESVGFQTFETWLAYFKYL